MLLNLFLAQGTAIPQKLHSNHAGEGEEVQALEPGGAGALRKALQGVQAGLRELCGALRGQERAADQVILLQCPEEEAEVPGEGREGTAGRSAIDRVR